MGWLCLLGFLWAKEESNAKMNDPARKAARQERVEAIRLEHAATDLRPSERALRFAAYKAEVAQAPKVEAPTEPMPVVEPKVRKPRTPKPKAEVRPDPPAEVTPLPTEPAPAQTPVETPEVAPEPKADPKPKRAPRVHRDPAPDPTPLPAPKPAKVPTARKTPRPLPTVKILGSGTASDADKLARYVAEMRAMREGA